MKKKTKKITIIADSNFQVNGLSKKEIDFLMENVITGYVSKCNGFVGGGFIEVFEKDSHFIPQLKFAVKDLWYWLKSDFYDFLNRLNGVLL